MGNEESKPTEADLLKNMNGGQAQPVAAIKEPNSNRPQLPDKHKTMEELVQCLRQAGIESMNLVVGFDFSKSNEWTGEKTYGKNLHGVDYLNPYLHTL